MLFIDSMLASADMMKICITNYIGDDFRYLIPDLSSHGKNSKQMYKSAKLEAEDIYHYLKENKIFNLDFCLGASIGGFVLFELLNHRDINSKSIFLKV